MSTITIQSAALINLGRDNVFTTTAYIRYTCSANFIKTSDEVIEGVSKTEYRNGTLDYSWTINSQQFSGDYGTAFIHNPPLRKKAENIITGTVTITCTERVYYYSWGQIQSEPTQKYGWILTNTESMITDSITSSQKQVAVYTQPGIFTQYNFAPDTIIESLEGLTAEKVNQWIEHCDAFNNWYNQPNTNVNLSNVGLRCRVVSGDYITATWYNNCINAIADPTRRPPQVYGGKNGTLITASVINALGTAISQNNS